MIFLINDHINEDLGRVHVNTAFTADMGSWCIPEEKASQEKKTKNKNRNKKDYEKKMTPFRGPLDCENMSRSVRLR